MESGLVSCVKNTCDNLKHDQIITTAPVGYDLFIQQIDKVKTL